MVHCSVGGGPGGDEEEDRAGKVCEEAVSQLWQEANRQTQEGPRWAHVSLVWRRDCE